MQLLSLYREEQRHQCASDDAAASNTNIPMTWLAAAALEQDLVRSETEVVLPENGKIIFLLSFWLSACKYYSSI